jgi:hypothetical protein
MKNIIILIVILILTSIAPVAAQYNDNNPVTWGQMKNILTPQIRIAREKGDSAAVEQITQLKKEIDSLKLITGKTNKGSIIDSTKVARMIRQQAVSMPKLAPNGVFAKLQKQVNCLADTVNSQQSLLKHLESRINIMTTEIELAKDSLGSKIELMKCGHLKKEEICKEIDKLKIKKDELDIMVKEKKEILEHN